MRLAVFSDAHRNLVRMESTLAELEDIDYLVYAGDGLNMVLESGIASDFELLAVQGNCDHLPQYPRERVIDLGEQRILLTHGKRYRIKLGLDNLYYKAQEIEADIVIFGHTHCRYAREEEGVLFFNPGSISQPKDSKGPSYGLLEIDGPRVDYEHVSYPNSEN
ncbi:MAG: metallophosphoesterase [Halanaerobacter sp.]